MGRNGRIELPKLASMIAKLESPNDATSATPPRARSDYDRVVKALRDHSGNVTRASAQLGINRTSLHRRISGDKNLQEILSDCRESLCDEAESKIAVAVKAGDVTACKFVLSTIGKNRGYSTRSELSGSVEAQTQLTIIRLPDNGRGAGHRDC